VGEEPPESAERVRADALRRTLVRWADVPASAVRIVRSPYRVCPLGAHVDHQRGCVTGMAVDRALLAAFAPTADGRVAVRSIQFQGTARFAVDAVPAAPVGDWADYARGAVFALRGAAPLTRGIVAVLDGHRNVAGLSSSAAAGVACLLALAAANGLDLDAGQIIELDRVVENDYIGLSNGILDQSMILLSRAGMLTHLDCADGQSRRVPLGGGAAFSVAVLFSGLRKALHATDYNLRVGECRAAAARLLKAAGLPTAHVPGLRDVPAEAFERHGPALPAPLRRRARHFFAEQERVARGVELWRRGDLEGFGRLVSDSGRSSIELYECGTPHLRTACEVLRDAPGVYGARFSGGGFRGCCVALVDPGCEEEIAGGVLREYLRVHPDMEGEAELFFCRSADGATLWE